MFESQDPDAGTTMSSFHAMAAKRGDGLHPLLLQAFAKTGSVSGPPAPSEQTDDNVVVVDFQKAADGKAPKRDRAR
ncbi:MAG: hypothetical protein AAGA50_21410 [Pseudomonadota bacterium]